MAITMPQTIAWTAATEAPSGIFFADAPRDGRGGGHAEADPDTEDQDHERLGQSHHRYGIRPELRHPEGIHHAEGGFHDHFADGGDGEQGDPAVQAAFGEVLVRPRQRLADETPLAGKNFWCCGNGFLHIPSPEKASGTLELSVDWFAREGGMPALVKLPDRRDGKYASKEHRKTR